MMDRKLILQSFFAEIFSIVTIGVLTILTYKTSYGVFLIASFGSTMVLLYGYPESPFAQPKNIILGHFLTALVGIIFLNYVPLPVFVNIPLAVGFGVMFMILFKVTHPPAGGNPIIVIIGSVSYGYLINPIILGALIVILFGVVLNRFVLRKKYPENNKIF